MIFNEYITKDVLLLNHVAASVALSNLISQYIHWHRHRQHNRLTTPCWTCLQIRLKRVIKEMLLGISILIPSLVKEYYYYIYETEHGWIQNIFDRQWFYTPVQMLHWCAPAWGVYNHNHRFPANICTVNIHAHPYYMYNTHTQIISQ